MSCNSRDGFFHHYNPAHPEHRATAPFMDAGRAAILDFDQAPLSSRKV